LQFFCFQNAKHMLTNGNIELAGTPTQFDSQPYVDVIFPFSRISFTGFKTLAQAMHFSARF